MLGISRLEAARLLAYNPPTQGMHLHRGDLGHWLTQHALLALGYAIPAAIRQARIIATEASREARKATAGRKKPQ